MQERSKRTSSTLTDRCARPISGPLVGLNAINGAGSSAPKAAPRLALRISRRWAAIAPMLRMSLPAGSTLQIFQDVHCERLTGLLRAGVDMRQIERLKLDDAMMSAENFGELLAAVVKGNDLRRKGRSDAKPRK